MKKLLVAIDFSEGSLVALAHARALGSVELVHIARTGVGARRARARLAKVAEGDPLDVRRGRFVDALLAACAERRADAIVLGVPPRSSSTARELVRKSRVPVLFARGETPARVVMAVDFSGVTRAALPYAFELASIVGTGAASVPLELVHVAEPGEGTTEQAIRSLAKLALEREDVGDLRVSMLKGDPAASIVEATGPRDIVVCGTSGHTWVEELAYGGGVARKLVARGRASVLVIGPSVERARARENATALRAIRARYAFTSAGCETALFAVCPALGKMIPLDECMRCESFAGLIGESHGGHVVRCRETAATAPAAPLVRDAMPSFVCVRDDLGAERARAALSESGAEAAAVVDERGAPCGILTRAGAEQGDAKRVRELVVAGGRTTRESAPLGDAVSLIEASGAEGVSVLDADGRTVLGALPARRVPERRGGAR